MKRPSFQFYPGDWQANSNLRRCTHEEKGVWIDVMCLLHDQEEYGVVRWSLKEIAQAIGSTVQKLRSLVNKGVLKGADDGDECDELTYIPRSGRKNGDPVAVIMKQMGPIWYSSRMVVDEYKRVLRGESGATPKATPNHSPKPPFGEPIGATPKATPNPTPDPSPSRARASSSSSSSSSPSVNLLSVAAASESDTSTVESRLDAAAEHEINPIVGRSIELVALLVKRGAAMQASDPRVLRWAEMGVTDAQALQALEIAQQRREQSGNPSAVNAGYIDSILPDVISKPKPKPREPAWWSTESGIIAKGREVGIEARVGETMPEFKARINAKIAIAHGATA